MSSTGTARCWIRFIMSFDVLSPGRNVRGFLRIEYSRGMFMKIPWGKPQAVACIRGEGNLRGMVKFYSSGGGTLVVAEVCGLPNNDSGFFALHIHEGTQCTGENFGDTGGHFNPGNHPHPRHTGDLPPLLSQNGRAVLAVETDRFTIGEVMGRTVVIHSDADDFRTQPAGNAGRKIGCGKIGPVC